MTFYTIQYLLNNKIKASFRKRNQNPYKQIADLQGNYWIWLDIILVCKQKRIFINLKALFRLYYLVVLLTLHEALIGDWIKYDGKNDPFPFRINAVPYFCIIYKQLEKMVRYASQNFPDFYINYEIHLYLSISLSIFIYIIISLYL